VQQSERGGIAFELLSLLYMLSHTPVAKVQIAEWENVATLVGILTCAHAAPRAKRIALRLALRFLPHAEPPTQDSFLSLLEYFLDAIGACLFDRAATSPSSSSAPPALIPAPAPPPTTIHTITTTTTTTTSYNDYSSDEDEESDEEGESAEWDDGEDVDMYEGDDGEDDEEDGGGVEEPPEQEADMFAVYLDVWTTGYKRYNNRIFPSF
jgi:hypothetical protein